MSEKHQIVHFHSARNLPLVFWAEEGAPTRQRPVLTVENYGKWYTLYLVYPNDNVVAIRMPDEEDLEHMGYTDRLVTKNDVPHPTAVMIMAHVGNWDIDEQAMDMIVGRWEREILEHYQEPP